MRTGGALSCGDNHVDVPTLDHHHITWKRAHIEWGSSPKVPSDMKSNDLCVEHTVWLEGAMGYPMRYCMAHMPIGN